MNSKKCTLMFGVWLLLYPLVTVLFYLIRTVGSFLPFPVQTLIATLIIIPLMMNWIVPFVKKQVEKL